MAPGYTQRGTSSLSKLDVFALAPALLLAVSCALEASSADVSIFNLTYSGDDLVLGGWRDASFPVWPADLWAGSIQKPCPQLSSVPSTLPYQGVDCGVQADGNPYVTKVDLSSMNLTCAKSGITYMIAAAIYLDTLDLSNNRLVGPLPGALSIGASLKALLVANNKMSGSISPDLCKLNLTCLSLANNNFSGPIPPCFSHFPCVDFENNALNFTPGVDCDNSTTVSSCAPPLSIETPPQVSSVGVSVGAGVGIVVGGLAFVGLLAAGLVLTLKLVERRRKEAERKKLAQDIETQISTRHFGTLRRFTSAELATAASDFDEDNLLGEGGFSKVYKGTLEDGKVVAIKKIKEERAAGELEFLNEVELISRAVHRNLMHCEGFCVEAAQCMLVLPFYANASVALRTHGKAGDPLMWPARQRIAQGAAEGIAYLHTDCTPKLIHRDIKADNVLLDEGDEAIIADFGLAKEMDVKETHRTTAVKGTIGHIAPEYFVSGQCSEKTDVYAFGVFLLELISGKDVLGLTEALEDSEILLRDWVRELVQSNRLSELVDPELDSVETDLEEVLKMVQVALLCIQPDPNDRPAMDQVAKMLVGKGLAERWAKWQDEAGQMTQDDVMQVINTPALWENTTTGISIDNFGTTAPR